MMLSKWSNDTDARGGTGNGAPRRWHRSWSTREVAQVMEHHRNGRDNGAPGRWSREWNTREVCTDYALNLGTIVTDSHTLTQLKPC